MNSYILDYYNKIKNGELIVGVELMLQLEVLKKEIAKIILPFALRNKLTKEKLEELLQQEIEKL